MPSVPPAASVPRACGIGYLRWCSEGSATVPMVAAVATDEPEVAANSAQHAILVCSSPPGRRDSQAAIAPYMRSAMPLRSSSSPSRMNSGAAVSRLSLRTPHNIAPVVDRKGTPKTMTPAPAPTRTIDTAIGRPSSISTIISRKVSENASVLISCPPPLRCAAPGHPTLP